MLIINIWRMLMKIRLLAESPLVFEDHKVQGREMYEKSGTTVVHLLLEKDGGLPAGCPAGGCLYVCAFRKGACNRRRTVL